jgi:16S rRNA (uracil1498-N3)-methyltransferase
LRLHAIEAAEQSWRLTVPEVAAPKALDATLETWPADAPLLYCDERRRARPMLQALKGRDDLRGCAWSILIGPEGGFTAQEQAALDAVAAAIPVSLGPRIVRAETAAVMALTLWQSVLGDLGK